MKKRRTRGLGSTPAVHGDYADGFAKKLRKLSKSSSCDDAIDALEAASAKQEHRISAGSWTKDDALDVSDAHVQIRRNCGCKKR